ncbi:hypothetical protein EKO04_003990 [Ascochyta lentis]|uniref:N-acetyltransferase domain-containing protein n=1 Tax=Ascochyta lentis TaxID=205686 RepID=A0A8H7MEJ6_9PLEO|nr:hypothetical protein EKO04_003990 [Ascochyta lentis]
MSPTTSPSRWKPISTPRLTLREYEASDEATLFTLESNTANAQYQHWGPWTREQARDSIAKSLQQQLDSRRTVVELAVMRTQTGEFLGRVGARVHRSEADIQVDDDGEVSTVHRDGTEGVRRVGVWFSFLPCVQGRGFATEAVRGLLGGLREGGGGEGRGLEVVVECDPRNEGSWKLAERLGLQRVRLVERAYESKGEWVGSLVYMGVLGCVC